MSEADSKFADSLVSQDALDELMKEAEEQPPVSPGVDEESKDLDLVSPEDIEKLLETTSDNSGSEQEESDLDLISQDDIDLLISGEELVGSDAGGTDDADDSLISQDDIDALLSGTDLAEDSGKAIEDADDSLISQDDIDALLGGIDLAEDSGKNTENDDDSLISQDDIDALLGGSDETDSPEDSDVSLISQEDIDSLLNSAGSDNETEKEKLVTQDDIDNLLAADEVVEDTRSETGEKLVSQDDIDKLLNADIDDDDGIDDYDEAVDAGADQVILEKGDEEDNDSGKKRLTTKIIIGCIVGVLLIIAVGVSIVVFSGSPEDDIVEMEVIDDGQGEVIAGLEEEMTEIEELQDTAFVIVELKDFVVPAPLTMKDISYISLDLTLEIVDVTSDPIKGYEPFFRNIIYEVLNKALELQSESRIIEADLIRMIKNALNDALSEGSVNKVSFLKFNMT